MIVRSLNATLFAQCIANRPFLFFFSIFMSRSLWTSLRPEIITLIFNIKLVGFFFWKHPSVERWDLEFGSNTNALPCEISKFSVVIRKLFISSQLDFVTRSAQKWSKNLFTIFQSTSVGSSPPSGVKLNNKNQTISSLLTTPMLQIDIIWLRKLTGRSRQQMSWLGKTKQAFWKTN